MSWVGGWGVHGITFLGAVSCHRALLNNIYVFGMFLLFFWDPWGSFGGSLEALLVLWMPKSFPRVVGVCVVGSVGCRSSRIFLGNPLLDPTFFSCLK